MRTRPPRRPTVVRATTTFVVTLLAAIAASLAPTPTEAATIEAAYAAGHRDVVINDYGTRGLGTFELVDGGDRHRALCIEAHVAHTDRAEAYRRVTPSVASPQLDALLWWLQRQGSVDDDTATAAAALAWFYAGAKRSIGPPVWSDSARDFAPITPVTPRSWTALDPFSMSHPVGLRSGGADLDTAERRTAELHALATAWSPPWRLTSNDDGSFVVTNDHGPISGVTVDVQVRLPGDVTDELELRTDSAGRVVPELPAIDDGASIRARVEAPGPHTEWDGDDIQRMATATTEILVADHVVPPLPRFVEVHKSSADPTISPAGAVFELADRSGTPIARAEADHAGIARFDPIHPDRHPAPYALTELTAPIGLVRNPDTVRLEHVSTDPDRPTVVERVNLPATVGLHVRKRITIDALGPPDRSGFEFVATRSGDGFTARMSTRADGRAGPLPLPLGIYELCETATPHWAAGLTDGGCVEVRIEPDTLASEHVEIEYVNIAPNHSIDTTAADPVDGDRVIETASTGLADTVMLEGLVPGTEYRLVGEVLSIATHGDGGAPSTVATTQVEFVASAPVAQLELAFELDGVRPGTLVVVERLFAGDTVVAEHLALDDPDQTVTVVSPATTVPATTTTSTAVASTTTLPAVTTTSTRAPGRRRPPVTMPPTGASEVSSRLLGIGDVGFVAGVALLTAATRRGRRDANGAEC